MGERNKIKPGRLSSSHKTAGICWCLGLCLWGCLLLVFAGCALDAPQSPKWSVDLTIPLANQHYDLPYIIEHADQPELIWDSISGARFEISRTLDTIFVGDNIRFADTSLTFADSLGLIALLPSAVSTVTFALTDWYAGPAGIVPPFTARTEKELTPLAELTAADFSSGILRLEVTNKMDLPIDSLALILEDIASSTEVGRAVFPGTIAGGQSESVDLELAGKSIQQNLLLDLYLRSPGGELLSIDDQRLEVRLSFPDSIYVTKATAVVPTLSRTIIDTFDFSADFQAERATFSGGELEIGLNNQSNLAFAVEFSFPDLKNQNNPLTIAGDVPAGAEQTLILDLQQVEYTAPVSGRTALRVQTRLSSSSSGVPVLIQATDRLSVEVQVSSPIIETITGILPPTKQQVEGLTTQLDWPEGFENAGLASGELQLEITSSLVYPGEYDLKLVGDQNQSLIITGDIPAATAGEPIASQVNIINAAALLWPVPATLSASGSVTYGDGITSGTVHTGDFLVPAIKLIAPLSLYLDDVFYHGEAEGIKILSDNEELDGRLGAASAKVEFVNHLPFGAIIEIRLADRREDLPGSPDVVWGPTVIAPALVDETGRTTQATTSSDVFTLTAEQSRLLLADSLFISEELEFYSTDGSAVTVRDSDYFDWRAVLQVQATIGRLE